MSTGHPAHPATPAHKPFDPNAAASPDAGIFGVSCPRDDAKIVLLPVPFDATTSYGGGASAGPDAILNASMQVDLLDHHFGLIYEHGLHMPDAPEWIRELSMHARALAAPIIARGGSDYSPADVAAIADINAAGDRINAHTYNQTASTLAQGQIPGLVGGDHSTPYGAIRACADHLATLAKRGDAQARHGLGILHIDAHFDLRKAFEGFKWSHASIMRNVLDDTSPALISKLVSVGIRDYCPEERDYARDSRGRVVTHFDADIHAALDDGKHFSDICARILADLPPCVYVSFDIDGLDPALCPGTGTPVPGGLSFNRAAALLSAAHRAGKRVIGFDLVEVCPAPGASEDAPSEWDANVGARILYKLCGLAANA
ncbi:MAG: agmatinase family protein [Phycisphaerales bacterium]|nr:agmatinase family protein [Phycisphaerales bacterium]